VVVDVASPHGLPIEEMRVDTWKLAGPTVICENASGKRREIDLRTLRILKTAGRVARLIQRRKDKAVTRVFLLAEPNEIATRITAQAEVVKVGASTWIHTRNLGLMGEARG
jgi:vacuolar-type H+-ATPase subunit B/Vma2